MRLPYSAVQVLKHVLQNQPLNFSSQILLKIGLMSYFFCKKIHGMDTWLKCHNMNLYNWQQWKQCLASLFLANFCTAQDTCYPLHSADHAVWKGYIFRILMPSIIGLQMNKNQRPLTRRSLVLKLCKNSFFNPLAFMVLALWPSKVAK